MKIDNLSLSFGTAEVYKNLTVEFNQNDKVGIIGVNGAGKTTLFKLILGELTPDAGTITVSSKIGYLPQVIEDNFDKEMSVFDYLLSARPIKELENKLTNLYEQIATEKNEHNLKKYMKDITKVEDELTYYEQYNAESVLLKIIAGMNIDDALLDLKLKNLSGGQKSKIAFARLLYSKPETLLLDEPTNHLDLDTKDYIIEYLKNYKGLILVISHDTSFLDEITNKTLYIDKNKKTGTLYNGSYSKYEKIKKEREANIAKDRQKKLEKLLSEKVEVEKKNKYTKFKINIKYPSYSIPISCNNLTFGYTEENLLYQNLTFDLIRGEKFLIVGENGIGKTTLLKLIMNILTPLEGSINISEKTLIGYYAQEHDLLNKEKTIKENFSDSGLTDYELRRFLGSFLFTNDDIFKKINILSPGERSRVALAKIALSGANTLLLDEPTNHLDPMTQLIIADTFKDYEGTMLVVSHNLEFVDNLGIERMLLLPSGRIMYYDKNVVLHYELLNEEVDKN